MCTMPQMLLFWYKSYKTEVGQSKDNLNDYNPLWMEKSIWVILFALISEGLGQRQNQKKATNKIKYNLKAWLWPLKSINITKLLQLSAQTMVDRNCLETSNAWILLPNSEQATVLLFVWSHLVRKRCRACTTNLLAKKNGQLVKCTPLSLSMHLSMQLSSRSNQWPGQDGPWSANRAAKQDETMQRKENLLSAYILFSLSIYISFYHSPCFPFSLFSSLSLSLSVFHFFSLSKHVLSRA